MTVRSIPRTHRIHRPTDAEATEAPSPPHIIPRLAPATRITSIDTRHDRQHDGAILGGGGKIYPPSTPLALVEPFRPTSGQSEAAIVYINGIMTDVAMHANDLQAIADTGLQVIGIHNATAGMVRDVAQCLGDKLNLEMANNNAVRTLSRVLYDALLSETPLHIVGHSQGALVASRALKDVALRLQLEDGLSVEETQSKLRNFTIETLGGSAQRFVDGPQYIHFINRYDFVPLISGVTLDRMNPFGRPGEGAIIHCFKERAPVKEMPSIRRGVLNWFARLVDRAVHGARDVYFRFRQ